MRSIRFVRAVGVIDKQTDKLCDGAVASEPNNALFVLRAALTQIKGLNYISLGVMGALKHFKQNSAIVSAFHLIECYLLVGFGQQADKLVFVEYMLSLRASAHTGVAIPRIFRDV